MKLAKEKKDLESQSLAYSEIINNLLQDKEELTLIAREYKCQPRLGNALFHRFEKCRFSPVTFCPSPVEFEKQRTGI